MNRKLFSAIMLVLIGVLGAFSLSGCGVKRTEAGQVLAASPKVNLPEPGKVEPLPDVTRPDVTTLLKAYNTRNFGSPGWRRVSLDLITNGETSRSFTVINLWKDERGEVRTLFLLQEPQGLSGTNYLLAEYKAGVEVPDMKVYLFLPAGQRQVLEIEPSKFNEGLLGSDFTYTDLRMQLPTRGYNYRLAGQCRLHNEPTWVIEAEPASEVARQSSTWVLARFYLAQNFQFLLGADYYSESEEEGGKRLSKRMRVETYEQANNVWTATEIRMFTDEDHYSILKMKDAHFTLSSLDSQLFQTQTLPLLADDLRRGWTPETMGSRQH